MALILDGTNGLSDVDGSAATPAIRGSDANTGVFFGTDIVGVSTGGSERVRVDASGNVGIGTSAPVGRLEVFRSDSGGWLRLSRGLSGTGKGSVSFGLNNAGVYSEAASISAFSDSGNVNNGFLDFATTNSAGSMNNRMRLDSSGNLLVGTTSTTNSARFACNNTAGTRKWGFGTSGSGTPFYVIDDATGSGVQLTAGATSWSAFSDERIKTSVVPFANAIEKITTLRAGTGRYLTDAENVSRSFLIAQDVQVVLPEAVDVSEDEQGTLTLRYTDLIPLLTAAIQEQQALIASQSEIISAQQTALTALTARVEALEGAQA
jgi:hypothetical protein